jgi:hypothetical protein
MKIGVALKLEKSEFFSSSIFSWPHNFERRNIYGSEENSSFEKCSQSQKSKTNSQCFGKFSVFVRNLYQITQKDLNCSLCYWKTTYHSFGLKNMRQHSKMSKILNWQHFFTLSRYKLAFIIAIDTSEGYAIGAVLSQIQEDFDGLIVIISQKST